jgi:hypothetical protein
MANLILNGSTSGSVTLSSPAVSGTTTLTLPTTTGKVQVGGPAFSAYSSSNQTSISSTTFTKVTFGTEEFDTNNNFASSTFTPTVAGYYQVNAAAQINSLLTTVYGKLYIYKNGAAYKEGALIQGQAQLFGAPTVSGLVYCNGSTDYVEIYFIGYIAAGTLSLNSAGETVRIWFDGSMVRSA